MRTPSFAVTRPFRGRGLLLAALLLAALSPALPSAAQPFPTAKPEEAGFSPERLGRLPATLRAYAGEGRLPGGVVLVARRGKTVLFEAFGQRDREAASPMATDAIFRIASQTKAIVSAAALVLQEEGKLLLSDPVGKYLPEFQSTTVAVPKEGGGYEVVKAKRPITLRDLLTQTAGIGYGSGPAADRWKEAGIQGWYFASRDEPIAETVRRMAALPFDAQPGEKWVYGYATDILGAALEKASGVDLETLLRTRILGPLGMKDTAFYLPAEKRARLAAVYSAREGRLVRASEGGGMEAQGEYEKGPRKSFSGGAGLLSTASDYSRFLQMLLNGGQLDGRRVLSRSSVALMTSNHVGNLVEKAVESYRGEGFGLGVAVRTDLGAQGTPGSVGEYGWGGAYHSAFWVDPKEGLVVVYLAQLIPSGNVDDFGKLRALVYQALEE